MSENRRCREFAATGRCKFKKCRFSHDVGYVPASSSRPRVAGNGNSNGGNVPNGVCRFTVMGQECKRPNCNFSHDTDKPITLQERREKEKKNFSQEDKDLNDWKQSLKRSNNDTKTSGSISAFFQKAAELVDAQIGIKQEVVRGLAEEGGLNRIKIVIEQSYAYGAPALSASKVFADQVLPLFKVLTHPDVVVSSILEDAVGLICRFLHGNTGERFQKLLTHIAGALEKLATPLSDGDALDDALNTSLKVIVQVVDGLTQAALNPKAQELIKRIGAVLVPRVTGVTICSTEAHEAGLILTRIERRLDIALSLPTVSSAAKSPIIVRAKFKLDRGTPGGRHDNDHDDIGDIEILPTPQEISYTQAEYLPVKDLSENHIQGLDGVLDRSFRLLREDTVDQLRDAVRAAQERLGLQGNARKSQMRTYMYSDVRLQTMDYDHRKAVTLTVSFKQPVNLPGNRQRMDWWASMKRLDPEALVCLVDGKGGILFCTVHQTSKPMNVDGQMRFRNKAAEEMFGQLHKDQGRASISLHLAECSDAAIWPLVKWSENRHEKNNITLVEFPGVLLPAFKPTLIALQRIKDKSEISMQEYIVPRPGAEDEIVNVQIPSYARRRGFSFNLKVLTNDGRDLFLIPGQEFDIRELMQRTTLDEAQALALVYGLTNEIALIQGPPGTGKSYVGSALTRVLLANKHTKTNTAGADFGPIIIVTYTNHSIDSLLESLHNKGVNQIVRIGGRSKSEILKECNLRTLSQHEVRTSAEKRTLAGLHQAQEQLETDIGRSMKKLNKIGTVNFLKYLRTRWPKWGTTIFGIDGEDKNGWIQVETKDKNKLKNRWIAAGHTSARQPRPIDILLYATEASLSTAERRHLCENLHEQYLEDIASDLSVGITAHNANDAGFRAVSEDNDLRILQNANVIGVTTSGLAKHLHLLRKLSARVLICEEAGEVLEPHLLTTFLPSITHAIMIGDHLQLKPQIQNFDLSSENPRGAQYSLDISLFERLIRPDAGLAKLPYATLASQRRMHPSISRLVRETLYPALQDAGSVAQYPEVVGVRKRLFWLDHQNHEAGNSQEDQQTSKWNQFEVDMVTGLVRHLIAQGTYEPEDIAVLTPYLGQLMHLKQELGKAHAIVLGDLDVKDLELAGIPLTEDLPATQEVASGPLINDRAVSKTTLLKALRIATVDNFQGEEAKVVILSLVRSNPEKKCGFLKTSNRINVALSRAQHGMYIVGDAENASHKVEMWARIVAMLTEDACLGSELELQCPRHPDTLIAVSEPDDFMTFSPEGGCDLQCVDRLDCGHACVARCHSDVLHKGVHCLETCTRPVKGCSHSCPNVCGDPCPEKCAVNVRDASRILPCGHAAPNLPCWQTQADLAKVKCPIVVERTIPGCEHKVMVPCHKNFAAVEFKCPAACEKTLPCGHACLKKCCECTKRGNVNVTELSFTVDHGYCRTICGRAYAACSHSCQASCHSKEIDCQPCNAPCETVCSHSRCSRKCSEPCKPCAEPKCSNECPHSKCTMPCAVPCNNLPCELRCLVALGCGHQCPSLCGEICPTKEFCQICASDEVLDRRVDLIMFDNYRDVDLDDTPCIFPPCGHFYTVTTFDGQMSMGDLFVKDADEKIVKFKPDSDATFSDKEAKPCPDCRRSLNGINRYSRVVRRAAIDEMTKRFIVFTNQQYVPLALELENMKDKMAKLEPTEQAKVASQSIELKGRPADIAKQVDRSLGAYYKEIRHLRRRISKHYDLVKAEEQPFQRIADLVEDARRRQGIESSFNQIPSMVQMRCSLQALSMLHRCDLLIITHIMKLRQSHTAGLEAPVAAALDFSLARAACIELVQKAAASNHVLQNAEGCLYFVQYAAFERMWPSKDTDKDSLLKTAQGYIDQVKDLINKHAGSTAPVVKELGGVERLLRGGTFYEAVSNEEMRAVLQAMARELRGTGHWYYCENNHPFTIGECGMAMQLARCPQCGAAIGGQNHRAVAGVRRADDLEAGLRGLRL